MSGGVLKRDLQFGASGTPYPQKWGSPVLEPDLGSQFRASASEAGVAGSQSTAPPRLALLSTLSDSSAHFMRVAEMSMPSRSRTNERSRRRMSSTFMPLTSSEAIEAAAWLIAQPWPS